MFAEEMKKRTRQFCLGAIKLSSSLPKDRIADVFVRQLARASTSVAANYRAACVARSRTEFAAKLGIVQEEADESIFWIELAAEAGLIRFKLVEDLVAEGKEILAIIVSARKTLKRLSKKRDLSSGIARNAPNKA